jgi:hypothetical protein
VKIFILSALVLSSGFGYADAGTAQKLVPKFVNDDELTGISELYQEASH